MSLKDETLEAFKWAEETLPGFVKNEEQSNYACLIADSLEKGKSSRDAGNNSGQLLVEGEGGTGKTLGYLVPAMLHAVKTKSRVVVSTYTLHLQKQIMGTGGDLDTAFLIVKHMTGQDLVAVRRIGRQHFADINRVTRLITAYQDNVPVADVLRSLLAWLETPGSSGEIADWLENMDIDLPPMINTSDLCLTSDSTPKACLFYQDGANRARAADVVLVTHAMLAITGKCGWRLLHDEGDNRPIGALIVDEADCLPMVTQNINGGYISIHSVKNQVLKASKIAGFPAGDAVAAADSLLTIFADVYSDKFQQDTIFWDDLPEQKQNLIKKGLDVFHRDALPLVNKLKLIVDGKHLDADLENIKDMIASATEIADIIEHLDGTSASDSVGVAICWSPVREYPSIKTFDLYPARSIKRLWSSFNGSGKNGVVLDIKAQVDCLVLTSATLSTPGQEKVSFWEAINDFGIYEPTNPCVGMHAIFSPKKFGDATFVFPDPSVPAPFVKQNNNNGDDALMDEDDTQLIEISTKWLEYAVRMIAHAGTIGRTFVLTTGYRMTKTLADILRVNPAVDLIEHCRGEKFSDVLDEFRSRSNAVLITPAGWEGVSLPGLIDNVIVAQLPFSPNDDVHAQALFRHLVARGKLRHEATKIISVIRVILAMKKFKQGFCRGIRTHKDRMVFWVADPRFPASPIFNHDLSGRVPSRGTAHPSGMFHSAVPVRFRSGIGNPFNETGRMFLADGSFVGAEEILEAMV